MMHDVLRLQILFRTKANPYIRPALKHAELKNVFGTVEKTLNELSIDYHLIDLLTKQIWHESGKFGETDHPNSV
jgi:hypothetical protein